ncbi:hypothetical protein [Pseudomonas sp. SCB32]|uniref:hypothetical protein n=1 Tax=Pseudomonas sp. SCB32 TaxID=2653853 RepID=UPI00273DAF3E|nr:hypothetical protein [Pseudomonas sp. SCB32]
MIESNSLAISWCAPIVPSASLAGVPLNIEVDLLECLLLRYLVDRDGRVYRFDQGPDLRLVCGFDEHGNGGYSFSIANDEIVHELKRGMPALSILVRDRRVFAIKVYDFSFPGELAEGFIYKGFLPGAIGLGSLVSDLLSFTTLEFDEAEE